ncbi:YciI family protein [Curtobacterium sp. VKM Ac-2922]|uniref:YciI family protein n=1 Tax=Curtobacterium sp. VKM Ac-2922 TaxID=2929475 RepID=UPI001FB23017|nr:YciI family protein [Curtobacterium sp. VKM Ac-2922]MCJ1714342.1 YciI family protein [Curtobacterium sp. VKM Ac-2922]
MQFLVNVIDTGQAAAAGRTDSATAAEHDAVDALNQRLQAEGRILFAGGLTAPGDAVVIDARGDSAAVSEGSLFGDDQYVAGFWVLDLPDVATARRIAGEASVACNRTIELRALQG